GATAAGLPRRPAGGAPAEVLVAPAESVVPLPDGVGFEQASTLPMNGLTALEGLRMLDLQPGQRLWVTGSAGLLGSFVVHLAKQRNLHVIGDAEPSYGADEIVPRGQLPTEKVDAVFDTALLYRDAFPAIRDG